ncbi:MAG: proline racemase family protein, partial [Candidatus Aminicenantales bacterium]
NWKTISAVDAHAAGEPLRVITGGMPEIPGDTILEKRRYFLENLDHFRRGLMWEPRGHADMYGAIITEPVSHEADLGVLFLHNEGLSTMCGHGIIALTTVLLETGRIPARAPQTEVRMDTPAGLVRAYARVEGQRVKSVAFHNVPSFVLALDETVDVPGLGKVRYDLAFGGAFYAFVQEEEVGVSLTADNYRLLIERGMAIKRAIADTRPIVHPFEKDLNFLYGTIFIGSPQDEGASSRNVCVFADGEVDRSPTGTGVSGRLAIDFARGEISLKQEITIESIIGTRFKGRIIEETQFGPYEAVIPEVEGSAHITGKHEFVFDPDDPLCYGFFLR